ncbi:MAG TPA: FAD-dependent tricarballylate dehydrogenase TcuA [Candidatus Limnocylindrales bacterium]|nr:FAD-dependent tricarballylate dehydrogenase TcuA [Candidatus Limnocylindrales bacterium]
MDSSTQPDVIVVGSGNAGFSAALTAREQGANVLMLEKAPREWVGGNSWFTAGAFRLSHDGLDDIGDLVEPLEGRIDLPPYTRDDYLADMRRVTEDKCDPELTGILIKEAREAAGWMRRQGIRWRLMNERQAHESGGHLRFWGGLALGTVGGGEGLIDAYLGAIDAAGVRLRTDAPVDGLLVRDGSVIGVSVSRDGEPSEEIRAAAVVLASGGFEADTELRAKFLGDDWRRARVRGTPYNTGEAMLAAVSVGAQPQGDWLGCHSIAWDAAAGRFGDRSVSNRYSRQGYPFGLVVTIHGERFVDEGADFRNYTYAKYGAEILRQPEGMAFQIFDANSIGLISKIDYNTASTSRSDATSIGELADQAGIDRAGLERTIREYNAAISSSAFDPTVLDGKGTTGIHPPKSNWALPIDTPPFTAFAVVCGITFTFGGLRINSDGAVMNGTGNPLPGLFAAGETVGGLFHHNYPGGTGLASGTVFGRRAGRAAATLALRQAPLAADPA